MHGNYGSNKLTNQADVILAVGMRFDDRVTGRLTDYAKSAKVIHIDIDPAELNKNVPAEIPIVADAKPALIELTKNIKVKRKRRQKERLKWIFLMLKAKSPQKGDWKLRQLVDITS
jgi:acetolactate synthase-1/2/3 large subunit